MRLVWAIALILSGCAGSPQWESAIRHKDVTPGRFDGGCSVFARELQKRMSKDGVPTQLVTYTATLKEYPYSSVRHQIVAYKVYGESWFIGNDNPAPIWVGHIEDPWERRLRQFYKGTDVSISNVVVE